MSIQEFEQNREKVRELLNRNDVVILNPDSVTIGNEVCLDDIEAGAKIGPGTTIAGKDTMIGSGTHIVGAATIRNCKIGRNCTLHAGEYLDSVLLDGCGTVGWARIRGNCAWEEGTQSAHNVDTKTSVFGYKTTLGSLINFCNVMMLGGTSPRLEVGAEVGSGTINFNFLPYGPTVGALIKPSTLIGTMESPFLSCADAPVQYDFIGGHSSLIAPIVIGLNTMVAAKTRVNPGIYSDGVLIGGGNIEKTLVLDVAKVRVLKNIGPKYRILIHQLAIAAAYRRWCTFREEWAKLNRLDDFEVRLIEGFSDKVDKFIKALEDYGDNVAKYIMASEDHSRSDHLQSNHEIVSRWENALKPSIRKTLEDKSGYNEGTEALKSAISDLKKKGSTGGDFYGLLAQLPYTSREVVSARKYFKQFEQEIISLSADL